MCYPCKIWLHLNFGDVNIPYREVNMALFESGALVSMEWITEVRCALPGLWLLGIHHSLVIDLAQCLPTG